MKAKTYKQNFILLQKNNMDVNMWLSGFKVFLFGFGGVFTGLITLMLGIKVMSTIVLKLETEEHKKDGKKNG